MLNLDTPFRPRKLQTSLTTNAGPSIDTPKVEPEPEPKPKPTRQVNRSSFTILWRKPTQRKNKSWDGDGILYLNSSSNTATVRDSDGMFLGRLFNYSKHVFNNRVFKCGGYECELNEEIAEGVSVAPVALVGSVASVASVGSAALLAPAASTTKRSLISPLTVKRRKIVTQISSRPPIKLSHNLSASPEPLFDPETFENPLIMPRPPATNRSVRDVVVDPDLSGILRPHQRQGIVFLYECIMGYREFKGHGHGAILADDMGLGKTLQSIALIWTLIRQTPFVGQKPIIHNKVLVCCPVTLVNNWKNEFHKWLGKINHNRLNILAIDGSQQSFHQSDKQILKSFANTKVYQVLIIGYEKMQSMSDELADAKFDLVICDEGHRLKNSSNKVFKTLESLNIQRRILLTGTPIQNDLTEFYNIINFTNPGVLGSFKDFQKNYMKLILRSRDPNCKNSAIIKAGNNKSEELIDLTKQFLLRRTNSEITEYLPKRSDYVLFAPPTKLQLELFGAVLKTQKFNKILQDERNELLRDSLSLITTFRKICNSPSLLKDDLFFLEACHDVNDDKFKSDIGRKVKSGKILLLMRLLGLIYQKTQDEKVVIISNFTQVLDILEKTLESLRLSYTRLDGSTPSKDRGRIVNEFNRSSKDSCFIFLLSAKAGGIGLNLTGASRLIMFDNDWNPSVDLQAMARIHREGQKKEVKIYRLVTSGCIDEKIFQRQLIKKNLSDRFLDDSAGSNEDFFNNSDLKDIFTVNQHCQSNTHDLMLCDCEGDGEELKTAEEDQPDERGSQLLDEPHFMTALNFSQKCQTDEQASIEQKQKQIQRCLKGYRHINPSGGCKKVSTDDEIIDTLLHEQDSNKIYVNYVFGKY
ncbi:hypothetical protein FOA43_001840 [Brettanomyces nanus]|uniref:Uncharacterized protein n=1 Tax=Eeniella nana TaxID=13502 RepID=A0A875RP30_EENNA|nr:uncharacterized protein FOA43_001840 [Brettanomyces nanus]QPG74510.1 hypothetical protein FOA43_001840 [Brettanomyces nanus]